MFDFQLVAIQNYRLHKLYWFVVEVKVRSEWLRLPRGFDQQPLLLNLDMSTIGFSHNFQLKAYHLRPLKILSGLHNHYNMGISSSTPEDLMPNFTGYRFPSK
jgi:hypothetical protein